MGVISMHAQGSRKRVALLTSEEMDAPRDGNVERGPVEPRLDVVRDKDASRVDALWRVREAQGEPRGEEQEADDKVAEERRGEEAQDVVRRKDVPARLARAPARERLGARVLLLSPALFLPSLFVV